MFRTAGRRIRRWSRSGSGSRRSTTAASLFIGQTLHEIAEARRQLLTHRAGRRRGSPGRRRRGGLVARPGRAASVAPRRADGAGDRRRRRVRPSGTWCRRRQRGGPGRRRPEHDARPGSPARSRSVTAPRPRSASRSERMRRFVADVSHELRTPLAAVQRVHRAVRTRCTQSSRGSRACAARHRSRRRAG